MLQVLQLTAETATFDKLVARQDISDNTDFICYDYIYCYHLHYVISLHLDLETRAKEQASKDEKHRAELMRLEKSEKEVVFRKLLLIISYLRN